LLVSFDSDVRRRGCCMIDTNFGIGTLGLLGEFSRRHRNSDLARLGVDQIGKREHATVDQDAGNAHRRKEPE
jgi:hypothetical protein